MIMGGGLEHDVVPNAMKEYLSIHQSPGLRFECKLLLGLQSIIKVGGEIKEFHESHVMVDAPTLPALESFTAVAPESRIVAELQLKMAQHQIQCPLQNLYNVESLKPQRESNSKDL